MLLFGVKSNGNLCLGCVALDRFRHFLSGAAVLFKAAGSGETLQNFVHGFLNAGVGAMKFAGRLGRQLTQLVAVLNAVKGPEDLV